MNVRKGNENLGEIYSARAMEDIEIPSSTISIPKIREPRDIVYSGTMTMPRPDGSTVNNIQTKQKKQSNKKKFSPSTIILILIGIAVISVLYIGNILAVGRLLNQINQLQIKHKQLLNEQEILEAQFNRLSSLERIQQLAQDQLGLKDPKQIPIWIEVDPERIAQVEEIIQQRIDQRR
jgi:cell division protein FtsL